MDPRAHAMRCMHPASMPPSARRIGRGTSPRCIQSPTHPPIHPIHSAGLTRIKPASSPPKPQKPAHIHHVLEFLQRHDGGPGLPVWQHGEEADEEDEVCCGKCRVGGWVGGETGCGGTARVGCGVIGCVRPRGTGRGATACRRCAGNKRAASKTLSIHPPTHPPSPQVLDTKVDLHKVNMDVIKRWITEQLTEFLGFEEEVTIGLVINLLETVRLTHSPTRPPAPSSSSFQPSSLPPLTHPLTHPPHPLPLSIGHGRQETPAANGRIHWEEESLHLRGGALDAVGGRAGRWMVGD